MVMCLMCSSSCFCTLYWTSSKCILANRYFSDDCLSDSSNFLISKYRSRCDSSALLFVLNRFLKMVSSVILLFSQVYSTLILLTYSSSFLLLSLLEEQLVVLVVIVQRLLSYRRLGRGKIWLGLFQLSSLNLPSDLVDCRLRYVQFFIILTDITYAKINIIIRPIVFSSLACLHSAAAYFYKVNVASSFLSLSFRICMIEVKKEYLYQIKLWCEREDVEAYACHFFDFRLFRTFNMSISFDERIIEPLSEIIESHNFIEYTPQPEHRSVAKNKLRSIIRILGENEFISRADWDNLTFKIENYTLKNSIAKFIEAAEKMQQQKGVLQSQTVQRIWKNTIHKNVEYIWTYLTDKKIIDRCIITLIDICRPNIKKFSIIKINQIDSYYDFLQKHFNPTQIPPTIEEVFPPSQQNNKAYNEIIDRFIAERSIFLNPEKRNLAYQQIRDVIATISCGNYAGGAFVYDLYGSMKTGFAILGLSDADIHITPPTQQLVRDQKIGYLLEVCKTLTINSLNKLNYFIQPYISEKIKVPFIKMKLDKTAHFNEIRIIKSIDIIIDTRSGIENSKILAMYSQSQYILKFGNLIKFWAKKKNIINAKKPTQGLSSYGVLLMALFYLIESKQAPYVIQSAQGYRLEKKLLGEKDYKPLLDNFKGFLDFYQPNGPFFSENMIVCLKENPTFNGHYYDKYLINMYDFIDGSNPGRLSKHTCDKFFSTLIRTRALLTGHHQMHEVMRYQQ